MANAIKYGPAIGPVGPVGPQGPPGTAVTGGRTFYLSNLGGSPSDYEGLALSPDSEPEEVMSAVGVVADDGETLMQGPSSPSAWVTEIEVPGVELIDAGVWTVKLFASATAGNGPSRVRFKLSKVTADLLTETLLFTWADSAALPTVVGSAAIDVEATAGTFDVDATDRLVLRAYAVTSSTTPVDVVLYHSGTAHYTRLLSPIVAATVYSDLTPLSGGTASPGVQNVASRGDHRHAHGIIAGGNTHALAVADVSHGYLSSTAAGALVGTSGTPGTANKFVTDADARNTNARAPTSHAATHAGGGADAIADAVASGPSGLISGADKEKLDNIEAGAQVVTATRVTGALATVIAAVSFNGQRLSSIGAPAAGDDADTRSARETAVAAAFDVSETVSGASPATTARTIVDVVFSYRVVSNAVVELAAYDMPATGASVAMFLDVQAFTEGTHANQMAHVIVGSGKRTSAGVSSRTSTATGGGSGQVVNDFAVTRPALSVSDPSSAVTPNVQHRLAVLYTGKSGVNTIVTGTARIVIGRVT